MAQFGSIQKVLQFSAVEHDFSILRLVKDMMFSMIQIIVLYSLCVTAFLPTSVRTSHRRSVGVQSVAAHDEHAVELQLGFRPSNLISIAARSSDGIPTVCMLYPLVQPKRGRRRGGKDADFEPFPTLYWLTCPKLKYQIAQLEFNGKISALEARLDVDKDATMAMVKVHRMYALERWSLLTNEDRDFSASRGWVDSLRDVGIGGLRDFSKVKCLHTMYAHFLALSYQDRNEIRHPVGEWIQELLDEGKERPEDDSSCLTLMSTTNGPSSL